MAGITLLESLNAGVPTPAAGKSTIFFSIDLGTPAYKDDLGVVHSLTGATGTTGAAGAMGAPGYAFDGEEGESYPIVAVGPQGNTGATGATGAAGPQGPPGSGGDGDSGGSDTIDAPIIHTPYNNPIQSFAINPIGLYGRQMYGVLPSPISIQFTSVGGMSFTTFGTTPVTGAQTDGNWVAIRTSNVSGNVSGLSVNTVAKMSLGSIFKTRIRTGPDILAVRYWICFPETFGAGIGNTGVNNGIVGVRYSTSVPDGGWVGFTQTTGAGGTSGATGTICPIAANTDYDIEIQIAVGGLSVNFLINGFSATLAVGANLPPTTATLIAGIQCTTLDGTIRTIFV